jgi:hypothetical protein
MRHRHLGSRLPGRPARGPSSWSGCSGRPRATGGPPPVVGHAPGPTDERASNDGSGDRLRSPRDRLGPQRVAGTSCSWPRPWVPVSMSLVFPSWPGAAHRRPRTTWASRPTGSAGASRSPSPSWVIGGRGGSSFPTVPHAARSRPAAGAAGWSSAHPTLARASGRRWSDRGRDGRDRAVNAVSERLLWRGVLVATFPGTVVRGALSPLAGFALWHLASQIIFLSALTRWRFVRGAG